MSALISLVFKEEPTILKSQGPTIHQAKYHDKQVHGTFGNSNANHVTLANVFKQAKHRKQHSRQKHTNFKTSLRIGSTSTSDTEHLDSNFLLSQDKSLDLLGNFDINDCINCYRESGGYGKAI